MTIEADVRHAVQTTSADGPGASDAKEPSDDRTVLRPVALLAAGLLAIFVVALGLRLIGLGGAVTEDEDQWVSRSGGFARGLTTRDWARTYQTGHPAVTVMWLTTLALGLDRTAAFATRDSADVTTVPDFLPALHTARVPFAVVQALLVVASAALVCRLLGVGVGLIAGLLLAAEPFWAGVGPVVGMDGLLAGFLTVSLLALMLALDPAATRRQRLAWAALSGLAAGLAFLTKTTALLAGPMVVILVALAAWRAWQTRQQQPWWLPAVGVAAVWATLAALTVRVVWPAAWASSLGVVVNALTFSAELGSIPHRPGNFFLGLPIEDPGPAFYPVALALRIGPGTTIGLLLLLALGARPAWRRVVWTLMGFVVLVVVLLTLSPKKVDRYLLPVLPSLGILAAVGWYEAGQRLRRHSLAVLALAVLALVVQVWPLVVMGRYPLAAYNPLFGGSQMAERAIPVGWGDGLDVAGDLVRQMAGGQVVVTAIWAPLRVNFEAHTPGPVVSQLQIAEADFFVDYVHARQRRLTPRELVNRQPDAVVTIGGVDYARIYRLR